MSNEEKAYQQFRELGYDHQKARELALLATTPSSPIKSSEVSGEPSKYDDQQREFYEAQNIPRGCPE